MVGVGGAVVGSLAWVAVTGLMARGELSDARAEFATLREQAAAGNLEAARLTAAQIDHHVGRAHRLTGGPVWALAARAPGGTPVRTVRGMTDALDSLTGTAVPSLLNAADGLDANSLRLPDGGIDLARLAPVIPSLHTASGAVAEATTAVRGLPQTGIAAIDSARADLLAELTKVDASLRTADAAASVVPDMLGATGPKTYLVALQNTAEARGTGGLGGAFGLLKVSEGSLRFGEFASDRVLRGATANVKYGPEYDQLYLGGATTTQYTNANLGAHFPYAAGIWASMWADAGKGKVDGVIAIDASTLGYLLAVTGPAKLADGTEVNAANVVSLTQVVAYERFAGDDAGRRQFLVDVAKAAMGKLTGTIEDGAALMKALRRGVEERRLLLWSADAANQRALEQTPVAGIVPRTTAPYAGLSVLNEGGNKLDQYLDRAVLWTRSGCNTKGAKVVATVTLKNNAPANLPAYVTERSDNLAGRTVKPGDNRVTVWWYATQGAQMDSVYLDGRQTGARIGYERGHPVYIVDVELPRGKARTVTYNLTEPAVDGPVQVLQQPLVRPLAVTVDDQACR